MYPVFQYHLGKVFTKLGISSRSQLDRVLPADPATFPPRQPGRLACRQARTGRLHCALADSSAALPARRWR
jgi:hypothetical protein